MCTRDGAPLGRPSMQPAICFRDVVARRNWPSRCVACADACVLRELAVPAEFEAMCDARRRTQVSARDAQKAFDMHELTPVKPGQAGQRSISDAQAARSSAAVRVLTQKKGASYRRTAWTVLKKRADPAIRVSGGKENPASLTRDCSPSAGTGRRTRSTTRACVHEGLSCF